jgi:hypothetical protein
LRELRIRFGAQLLTGFAKGHEDVIQRSAFRGFPGFRRRLAPLFVITDNDVGALAGIDCSVTVVLNAQNDSYGAIDGPTHAKAPPDWFGVAGFQSCEADLRAGFSLRSRGST